VLEHLSIARKIILKLILKIGWEAVDSIHLAQGKVQGWTVSDTIIRCCVTRRMENE
jgi:hypothetical protein